MPDEIKQWFTLGEFGYEFEFKYQYSKREFDFEFEYKTNKVKKFMNDNKEQQILTMLN